MNVLPLLLSPWSETGRWRWRPPIPHRSVVSAAALRFANAREHLPAVLPGRVGRALQQRRRATWPPYPAHDPRRSTPHHQDSAKSSLDRLTPETDRVLTGSGSMRLAGLFSRVLLCPSRSTPWPDPSDSPPPWCGP